MCSQILGIRQEWNNNHNKTNVKNPMGTFMVCTTSWRRHNMGALGKCSPSNVVSIFANKVSGWHTDNINSGAESGTFWKNRSIPRLLMPMKQKSMTPSQYKDRLPRYGDSHVWQHHSILMCVLLLKICKTWNIVYNYNTNYICACVYNMCPYIYSCVSSLGYIIERNGIILFNGYLTYI